MTCGCRSTSHPSATSPARCGRCRAHPRRRRTARATPPRWSCARLADGLLGLDRYPYLWLVTWLHHGGDEHARCGWCPGPPPPPARSRACSRHEHPTAPTRSGSASSTRSVSPGIMLAGADVVDGTPVLDLKPWFADCDLPRTAPDPRNPRSGGELGRTVAGENPGAGNRTSTADCVGHALQSVQTGPVGPDGRVRTRASATPRSMPTSPRAARTGRGSSRSAGGAHGRAGVARPQPGRARR